MREYLYSYRCPFYAKCWHGEECRRGLSSEALFQATPVNKPKCFKEKDDEAD